jgi:hypothetical protein
MFLSLSQSRLTKATVTCHPTTGFKMQMTREQFVSAAKKGWETLGYCRGHYYRRGRKPRACAIGAAACALDCAVDVVELSNYDFVSVAKISDNAKSKKKAIAALEDWAKNV